MGIRRWWNIGKGAAPSSADRESDRVLSHRIALVNDIFRSLNQTNSVSSFRFKADLLRTRKVYNKCSRTTVNFNLFKDGIHPGTVLAQYWARRFAHRAVLDR